MNCCVQACKQTQRDTQGRKRTKCGHVGDTNNTPPHANRESDVIQTSNRARVWQIWEANRTLEISSHVQKPRKTSGPSSSSLLRCTAERAISILALKNVDFKLTHDGTGDRLSRVRTTQTTLLAFCAEGSRIIVGIQQLDRIMSVLKFCHIEQISAWNVLKRMEPPSTSTRGEACISRDSSVILKPFAFHKEEQLKHHKKRLIWLCCTRPKKLNKGWIINVHSKQKREQWRQILVSSD